MAKSSINQEQLIIALMTSRTHREAAEKIGINERTVKRYLQRADFIALYTAEKAKLLETANTQIQAALNPSIKALRDIVENKKAGPAVRVQAARTILEFSLRLGEYIDLDRRIKALEKNEITEQTEL